MTAPDHSQTSQQRERATTIFEKGAPGRRAFRAPDLDVPQVDGLIPEALRRAEPPRLPEASEPEIVRHYVNLSKRNFDLDSGFYPLGSCTMKHNPRLHERVAALPGHARLHPLQDPRRAQGALELMFNLQEALAEIAGLPHVSLQPSAGSHGELAGVLLDARLPRRPRRAAHEGAHARLGARHEPGDGDDGRLSGRQGRARCRRRRRRRRPAREGRRERRVPDAHEPEHAGHLRSEHRGDRRDRARRGGDAVLRRREPQRGHGLLAARRHGLRHRALQPAQDVHAAARRRRPGRRPDRRQRPDRAVPAAPAGRAPPALPTARPRRPATGPTAVWSVARRRSTSITATSGRSAGCAASRATTASSCAPTRTSARSAPRA